jgi:hypothetical protein
LGRFAGFRDPEANRLQIYEVYERDDGALELPASR